MTTAGDKGEVGGLGVLRNRIVVLRNRIVEDFKPDPANTR